MSPKRFFQLCLMFACMAHYHKLEWMNCWETKWSSLLFSTAMRSTLIQDVIDKNILSPDVLSEKAVFDLSKIFQLCLIFTCEALYCKLELINFRETKRSSLSFRTDISLNFLHFWFQMTLTPVRSSDGRRISAEPWRRRRRPPKI